MGTDTVHNQAEDRDKNSKRPPGQSQGEKRNSILGSKGDSPATNTATEFQSDQQYPATAFDPVVSEHLARNRERATAARAQTASGRQKEQSEK